MINAGTNDNGGRVTDEDFYRESDKFLSRVREVYPDAQIIWLYGMMGLRYKAVLDKVISEKNDPKMHFLPVACITDEADEKGAVGHPNEKGQKRAAKALIEKISSLI